MNKVGSHVDEGHTGGSYEKGDHFWLAILRNQKIDGYHDDHSNKLE